MLATPRLITWLEAATVHAAAEFTGPGQTTVGTAVRIEHRRPTRVGGAVDITAEPPAAPAGRRLTFKVQAVDDAGQIVASGEIDRAIVDRQKFLKA